MRRFAAMGWMWMVVAVGVVPLVEGAGIPAVSRDPYIGYVVVDAATGAVLDSENANKPGYPASVVKLMNLLIVLEQVKAGRISLEDKVQVTAEVSKIGGSQVYLKEKEVFTVDELVYGMIVQSGNDAATALALHVAGSTSGFVALMNERAAALGMKATRFESVHGLPPTAGQKPDVSCASDLALLGCEVVKHAEALRYTNTRERTFRKQPEFIMRTHNNLLGKVEGCDGLKTGYFRLAGFSIVATAERDGRRVVAVVLGSKMKAVRDKKAAELIGTGFLKLPAVAQPVVPKVGEVKPVVAKPAPASPTPAANVLTPRPVEQAEEQDDPEPEARPSVLKRVLLWIGGVVGLGVVAIWRARSLRII